MNKKSLLACGLSLLALSAQAQGQGPLQIIAQQPPGSGSDAMTRAWGECVARQIARPVVVHNKPGANGILAINYLKGLPADGANVMTIGMSQMTITPYVHQPMPYDPLKDFDGIAVMGSAPLVLVAPAGVGVQKLADLEKPARAKPGGLDYGSPGKGSPAHLLTTALAASMQWPATHVPFVGESAGLTALMGRQIQVMTLVLNTAVAQVKAGKLVALAVFSGERSPLLPDVPTIAEAGGPQVLARPSWVGAVAKKGTPVDVLRQLNDATNQCNTDPLYRDSMEKMGVTLLHSTPSDVLKFAQRDIAVWKPLIDQLELATQ